MHEALLQLNHAPDNIYNKAANAIVAFFLQEEDGGDGDGNGGGGD